MIDKRTWGTLPDGREASLFHLQGDGVAATISDYGGIIQSLRTPDRSGAMGEIGLGFETLAGYLAKPNYFGALIGRVANRIRDGRFVLDGKTYSLYTDASGIHLHGGKIGFNQKLWRATVEGDRLRLDYRSPDGEENYPGNLDVTVWYEVRSDALRIDYEAVTDQPTVVNLTNHEFFNLNGGRGDILNHEARIQAEFYTPVDATLLPTGEVLPVVNTPMDFTTAKPIGRDLEHIPEGYDHNYVLSRKKEPGLDEWLVNVFDPDSGRTLDMATTEPCVQLYIGNFLDGTDVGIGGTVYKKRYGFCLETQKHPDAINQNNFACTILRPGETYRQTTIYRFGVR
ncbi:MAG: galactose mutarotase [Planctomycetaceae bacterium]|nr:galactose mutarotase [Planctomycetaceae bacterium]